LPPEEAAELYAGGLATLDQSTEDLRDALDEHAAGVALPTGLIDRALS